MPSRRVIRGAIPHDAFNFSIEYQRSEEIGTLEDSSEDFLPRRDMAVSA